MKKMISNLRPFATAFSSVLALAGMALPLAAHAQSQAAKDDPEARPYISVQLASVLSASASGPDVQLGGPVSLKGSSTYGHGQAVGLLLGREFRHERDDNKDEPRYTRLELEYWNGKVEQRSLSVGTANLALSDKLPARALLINGLVRIGVTENSRWWLGAGLGMGEVSHPDRQGAVPDCHCLGPAKSSGLAWRIKLQGERQLNADTALYLQLGYLNLPGASTAGLPTTQYGKLGVTDLAIGVRQRF